MVKVQDHHITSLAAKKILSAYNKQIKKELTHAKIWSMGKKELEKALRGFSIYDYDGKGEWTASAAGKSATSFSFKIPTTYFTKAHLKDMNNKLVKNKNKKELIKKHFDKISKEHKLSTRKRKIVITEAEMKYFNDNWKKSKFTMNKLLKTTSGKKDFLRNIVEHKAEAAAEKEMEKPKPKPKPKPAPAKPKPAKPKPAPAPAPVPKKKKKTKRQKQKETDEALKKFEDEAKKKIKKY